MTATTTISQDLFRTAVAGAVLAPSMYNVQPWRFRLNEGAVEVHTDPRRALPVADPDGWAARIACGAAIANLRLSLAVAGIRVEVRIRPLHGEPTLVATVSAVASQVAAPRDRALHAAIPNRHSNRRPFVDTPVPADVRAHLQAAADDAGAWLVLLSDRVPVAQVAEIIRTADEVLHRSDAYAAEMCAWIGRDSTEPAGITHEAAGWAPAGQDLLAMREFGGIPRVEGRDFETDPLLAVLGTSSDGPDGDVLAGTALQMVLLTATEDRLATSMLSQPIEVPAAREALRQALRRHGTPQMIVRIGYGEPTAASSRRPVDEVIDTDAGLR